MTTPVDPGLVTPNSFLLMTLIVCSGRSRDPTEATVPKSGSRSSSGAHGPEEKARLSLRSLKRLLRFERGSAFVAFLPSRLLVFADSGDSPQPRVRNPSLLFRLADREQDVKFTPARRHEGRGQVETQGWTFW